MPKRIEVFDAIIERVGIYFRDPVTGYKELMPFSFDVRFKSIGEGKIEYTGGVLMIASSENEECYNSGDEIPAGDYVLYSNDPIDNVKFINDVYAYIHIEKNDDQTNAQDMCYGLTNLVKLELGHLSFYNTINMRNAFYGCKESVVNYKREIRRTRYENKTLIRYC